MCCAAHQVCSHYVLAHKHTCTHTHYAHLCIWNVLCLTGLYGTWHVCQGFLSVSVCKWACLVCWLFHFLSHAMHVFCVWSLLPILTTVKGHTDLVCSSTNWTCCGTSFCLCSDDGEALADRLLSLRSVNKLCIFNINPAPVLRVVSENAEHCTVSTLGIAFSKYPQRQLVRSVSMGPCNTSQPVPLAHLYTLCVHGCTQAHVADLFVVHFVLWHHWSVCHSMCWSSVCYCAVSFDWL